VVLALIDPVCTFRQLFASARRTFVANGAP
jgi:hypothetical protein